MAIRHLLQLQTGCSGSSSGSSPSPGDRAAATVGVRAWAVVRARPAPFQSDCRAAISCIHGQPAGRQSGLLMAP